MSEKLGLPLVIKPEGKIDLKRGDCAIVLRKGGHRELHLAYHEEEDGPDVSTACAVGTVLAMTMGEEGWNDYVNEQLEGLNKEQAAMKKGVTTGYLQVVGEEKEDDSAISKDQDQEASENDRGSGAGTSLVEATDDGQGS